ncbi:hypothetical protein HY251_08760 [bacterium]|nr:hypothetical protein [bacterium]
MNSSTARASLRRRGRFQGDAEATAPAIAARRSLRIRERRAARPSPLSLATPARTSSRMRLGSSHHRGAPRSSSFGPRCPKRARNARSRSSHTGPPGIEASLASSSGAGSRSRKTAASGRAATTSSSTPSEIAVVGPGRPLRRRRDASGSFLKASCAT